jgi:hypothetical protein
VIGDLKADGAWIIQKQADDFRQSIREKISKELKHRPGVATTAEQGLLKITKK